MAEPDEEFDAVKWRRRQIPEGLLLGETDEYGSLTEEGVEDGYHSIIEYGYMIQSPDGKPFQASLGMLYFYGDDRVPDLAVGSRHRLNATEVVVTGLSTETDPEDDITFHSVTVALWKETA